MIVPRAYMDKQKRVGRHEIQNEKATPVVEGWRSQRPRPLKTDALRLPTSPLAETYSPTTKTSAPVQIPRNSKKPRSPAAVPNESNSLQELPTREPGTPGSTAAASATPVKSLLSSTAIPLRKKGGRKSQKLPKGDHVADFSKLILEDIGSGETRNVAGSFGNPHLEELFGHSVDTSGPWKTGDRSAAAASPFSVRSMSSESMPSLLIDDELTDPSLSDLPSPLPLQTRNSSERRIRTLSTSQDCADDHPLQALDPLEQLTPSQEEDKRLPAPSLSPLLEKPRNFSLRSNLTASLRALRSAAQSVSNLGMSPPLTRPDDFLTRSIFSFAPELTDDKRPPPSNDPPSPALRRYLNPQPTTIETITYSPAELHSYHEYPSRSPPPRKKKPVHSTNPLNPLSPRSTSPPISPRLIQIPLRTCLPPAHRTPTASSPPIWLSPDGTPLAQPPSFNSSPLNPSLARQREPRENPAFLRVLVGEMNMRRAGKFDESAAGRARIWLPPRKGAEGGKGLGVIDGAENGNRDGSGGHKTRTGAERWFVMSVED